MNKHPALQRPLTFGDAEQIEALEELRLDAEAAPYAKWDDGDPIPKGCREYYVDVWVNDDRAETVFVVAKNIEQAARVGRLKAERLYGSCQGVADVDSLDDEWEEDDE